MKKIFKYKLLLLLISGLIAQTACKKDKEDGGPAANEANITNFVFGTLNPPVTATISGTNVTAQVPFGTDVTALQPTIGISTGAKISPASGLARDFTNPVSYTVTAKDGTTTRDYTVTVTIADPTEAVINTFSVPGATGVDIDQVAKTIVIRLPEGTDATALVPTITTLPAEASVNPASGVAQDFSSPVTYEVSIGSVKTSYTVSVVFLTLGMNVDAATVQFAGNVLSATLPNELSSMGDNERGASMNSTHVYVASKGSSEVFYWKNDGSSVAASTLKKTNASGAAIVSGGIFALSDVVATENGILASNMNWAGGEFRIYRWANNEAPAELFFSMPAVDPANGTSPMRFGDAITFTGDPYGSGILSMLSFPGGNSEPNNTRVFWWQVTGGAIANPTPNIIELKDIVRCGNYSTAEFITLGGEQYLFVNGAEITPSIFDLNGNRLTNIATDAIPARTISGKIFEFNGATYMALGLPGSEGGNIKDAGLSLYNISGDNVIDVLANITLENVENYKVIDWPIGQNTNGNVAADVSVVVGTNEVTMMAFATNNGFTIIKAPISQ